MSAITTVEALEACIGAAGLPVKMKIIDHLDAQARRWIAESPLAFVGVATAGGPRVGLASGARGFAGVTEGGALRLPRAALEGVADVAEGRGAGVLFLVPGIGETLRANGRVARADDEAVEIAVEECFVHCAKALIRSDFWRGGAGPAGGEDGDPAAFVNGARFLALATQDADGRIDISPKGDPAGLLVRLEGERATLAERPGNRLAFGYRNILADPRVAALAIAPGSTTVATFEGRAGLTRDEALRSAFVVEGKSPLMATVIDGVRPRLGEARALAGLWPAPMEASAVDPAEVLMAHVKLNRARGVTATLVRLSANRGLIASGLKANYKSDLY
ncbi:pyridoxamine 5'-phosphate oxidase family protein [Phenylobacterium sp.]|uniref:pyridoxamine 5'-phosphate oxidase family protein n=1 Tax=Phenylobacterium sp. TaxID=1871053 RepID=UPI00301D5464